MLQRRRIAKSSGPPFREAAPPGCPLVHGSRACAAADLDRVTRQKIRRGKPSATGALQFEHGKGPFTASYDQIIAVRPDDGSRDAEIAGSRLRGPDLDPLRGQRSKSTREGVKGPHLAIDVERRSSPIDRRVVAGDLAGIARTILLLRESLDMAVALEAAEWFLGTLPPPTRKTVRGSWTGITMADRASPA